MRSQRMILISFMVTLGSGALAYYLPPKYRKQSLWGATNADGEFPPMRFFLGTGIVFFGISAVGEFQPKIAGPFAALVMTTAGMFNGVPALEYLTSVGAKAPVPSGDVTTVEGALPAGKRLTPTTNPSGSNTGGGYAGLNRPAKPVRPVKQRMFANPNRPNNVGRAE